MTASGVTLLIRQNTEQGDTYDEVALKEYSMDALKAIISGKMVQLTYYYNVMFVTWCLLFLTLKEKPHKMQSLCQHKPHSSF